jgi:hypothetical protein
VSGRRVSSLASALAVAFAHGPLAGVAPAFATTRDGATFTRRISWAFDGGGAISIEARAGTLDACDERAASHILRLWPELEEAAGWL